MSSLVKRIKVYKDWRTIHTDIENALHVVGATEIINIITPVSELLEANAERYEMGLGPKPPDPLEVRLKKTERSMEIFHELAAGRRVRGAVRALAGAGRNWALTINYVDQISYCDVSIVSLCAPGDFGPGNDPSFHANSNDQYTCQQKAERVAALLA